ncbi:MAG: GTP-binding protein [Clostridia bacterium]|nr:GTP-binding protein [Clostridia bacterium]
MKVDIFSGFLGAGKTTLIKKLISEAFKGEKLVLIENEFGEIGIDGGFMRDAGIEITEMNSGCICCSLVGDFAKALAQVYEQFSPDRIIIEPSGVGKLSDVTKAVIGANLPGAVINSCTTVVNAAKCKMYMKNFGEFFNDQIENAGCIIMSHAENVSEEKLADAVALVRAHNATAEIVTTPLCQISGEKILSAMEHTDTLGAEIERLQKEMKHHHEHHHHDHEHDGECCCHDHEHHHDHEHEHHRDHEHEHHHDHDGEWCCHDHEHHHGHHHADEVFVSWGRETAKKFSESEISEILKKLDSDEKYGTILRAKGIVAGEDGWIHFDYIPGGIDVRKGCAETCGRLCVIGCELNEKELAGLFGI